MDFRKSSIENLRCLGYTQDEARFLYLVAMHSGYFSARQYLTFAGAKSGEKSMAFTQKVLGKVMPRPVCCSETVVSITCFRASSIEPLAGNIFATAANIPSSTCALNWRFWILSLGTSTTGISKPRMTRLLTSAEIWVSLDSCCPQNTMP